MNPYDEGTPHTYGLGQRLLDAIARGEVTKGGMAEAGWFDLGTLADDGIVHTRKQV